MNSGDRGATSDAGAATIWALALVSLLVSAALVVALGGSLALGHAKADTVADLAALAGAQAMGDPCDEARQVAEANAMQLLGCVVDVSDVVVEVGTVASETTSRLWSLLGRGVPQVTGTARAGQPEW